MPGRKPHADATLATVFAPVRSQTAFEETVDRLGTAIKLGLLTPGTRLPPERELCSHMGIARSTLRQALTALTETGHLYAVRGRGGGTFVADPLPPADRRCFEAGALGTDGPWSFDPRLLAGARAAAGPNRPNAPFFAGTLAPKVDEGVIELADLVAAVEHPTRAFLRQRLGLSLRTDDDRPADALDLSLDGLGKWQVGDRILAALLEGRDADAVCAAERARGALPPGALGERVLADTRTKADRIAEAARAIATGPSGSLEVDVALPDGRHVVGTVADVFPGGTIRPATFSSMSAKLRLRLWVHHLAASATPPGRALTSIQVARWGAKFRQFGLPPIDADVAVAHLADLATLRDEVLCAPLPLYCATSFAWVTAQRAGDEDPVAAAAKEWTSDFRWTREDRDAEHLLVHDGQRPLDDVLADPAFEALARRLWTPLLDEAKRWSS